MINNDLLVLKNKEVLVTGGCGFIGSEIVKQLSMIGANVTIIDNLSSGKEKYVEDLSNVKLITGDLLDDHTIESVVKDKEYVINNAALPFIPDSYYIPKKFFDVNVNATISMALSAIKEKKVKRFVHISSSEIYGTARYTPMDENHQTTPQSTYAVSKLAGERVVFTMYKEHNLPAVIIRPFNSFGPNITQPYIIPEIITQIMKGDVVKLGNLNAKRDLTFVSDPARGIILSLVKEGVIGEVINIGSQRSYSIKDLVEIINKKIPNNYPASNRLETSISYFLNALVISGQSDSARYYANLYDMKSMPSYQMEALAYHEGIRGHHMQICIAQEL